MGKRTTRLFQFSLGVAFTGVAGCGSADSGALFTSSGRGTSLGSGGAWSGGVGGFVGLPPSAGGSSPIAAGGFSVSNGGSGRGANVGAGGSAVRSTGGAHAVDAGADAGDPLSGLPPALRELAKCSFTGTWATFVRVPVTWPGAPFVLNAGQGEVKQWTISHRVQDSLLNLHETVIACSIFLPDLTGSVLTSNQKFGIRFPDELFDKGKAPPYPFKTTVTLVGNVPQWTTEPVATLTGLSLPNPASDPWPSPAVPADFRDDDMDGSPGATVLPVDPSVDATYNWPPVGLPTAFGQDYPRAKRISIIARSVAKLHGTVQSCDELQGAADIVVIGNQPAINSTVIGCVKTDGQTCSSSEASFVDQIRPQFAPSGPGTLISVRLPPNATCADARARFPN